MNKLKQENKCLKNENMNFKIKKENFLSKDIKIINNDIIKDSYYPTDINNTFIIFKSINNIIYLIYSTNEKSIKLL